MNTLNTIVLTVVVLAGVMLFFLPRRFGLIPFLLIAPLIPPGQFLVIGPFTFYVVRVLLICLLIRVLVRSEYRFLRYNRLDTLILLHFICGTLAYVALRRTPAALVNRLGWAFDGVGIYFAIRWLTRDSKTWERVLKSLAIACTVIAAGMLIEYQTGQNPFSILGAVAAETDVRDGLVRSQGPFGHSILAGVFAANLAVLFVSLTWLTGRRTLLQLLGLFSVTIIVFTSSSSTPFMALATGLLSLAAWPIHRQMRLVRWTIALSLVLLQLVMTNPVWAIVAKFRVFGGSTGWYRFHLLDTFIDRFSEWCFLGIESTRGWGQGLWDVTIMYCRVGVDGGFITLVIFLAVIVQCFKKVGQTIQRLPTTSGIRKCIWALGASLTAHIVTFFGVTYWDQNIVPWYMLLAVIAGCAETFAEAFPMKTSTLAGSRHSIATAREMAGIHVNNCDINAPTALAYKQTSYLPR